MHIANSDCNEADYDFAIQGTGVTCAAPTVPTVSATLSSICSGNSTTLSITSGTLNSATNWQCYAGGCGTGNGGTAIGTGTSINVSPSATTTYYIRGEGGCVTSGSCANITVTVNQVPTTPTLSASESTLCNGTSTSLSIASGNLNSANNWFWYSGSCGGTALGSGSSINVSPTTTTTYYARGEGSCNGSCGSITVIVNGAAAPSGSNAFTGNVTITTQTEMDAFYNTAAGTNNGKRFTKITGNLVLDGGHSTDPINNLCNLNSLTEIARVNGVGGGLTIINFNKTGNPTDLSALSNLATIGCTFSITDCPQLIDATLPNVTSIGCFVNLNNNAALQTINIPYLQSVQGGQFNIRNNPKLQTLSLSTSASSFAFTGNGSSVDISNNGNSASGNLTMNLKKITTIRGALVFNNNDNPGVSNFDNIFTGLTSLPTSWGKLTITNNDYLGTCCIAASVTVSGTGKRHIISGNTGNCADSITVYNNCGSFNKKGNSPKGNFVTMDVYPNPSNGNFSLDIISEQAGMVSYTITDMLGRQVLSQTQQVSSNTTLDINMESAQAGQYIIKAQINGQVFVKRIVVVR